MSLKITFVTETFPPEVNGVAMTVGVWSAACVSAATESV